MSRFAPHRASSSNARPAADTICQKCLGKGHFTFNCQSKARPYTSRPSRSQMLAHPEKYAEISQPTEIPDEFLSKKGLADKILKEKAEKREVEQGSTKKKLAIRGHSGRSSRWDGVVLCHPNISLNCVFKFFLIFFGHQFIIIRFGLGFGFF